VSTLYLASQDKISPAIKKSLRIGGCKMESLFAFMYSSFLFCIPRIFITCSSHKMVSDAGLKCRCNSTRSILKISFNLFDFLEKDIHPPYRMIANYCIFFVRQHHRKIVSESLLLHPPARYNLPPGFPLTDPGT
jgi:hypothetical protein